MSGCRWTKFAKIIPALVVIYGDQIIVTAEHLAGSQPHSCGASKLFYFRQLLFLNEHSVPSLQLLTDQKYLEYKSIYLKLQLNLLSGYAKVLLYIVAS